MKVEMCNRCLIGSKQSFPSLLNILVRMLLFLGDCPRANSKPGDSESAFKIKIAVPHLRLLRPDKIYGNRAVGGHR